MNTRSEVCRALAHLTQKETSLDFVNICVRNHIYTNGIEKVINSINERGYGPSICSIITEKQKNGSAQKNQMFTSIAHCTALASSNSTKPKQNPCGIETSQINISGRNS